MPQYNVHEAKTQFSRLLKEVEQGEDVIIMRSGAAVARLVRYRAARRQKTQLGFAAGQVRETPGWEKAMTEEEVAKFLGIH